MIKILSKPEIEGNILKLKKNICKKCTANIILIGKKLDVFLPKISNKTGIFSFTTSIQLHPGSSG